MSTPRDSTLAGDGPHIRPFILNAKRRLSEGRGKLREDHRQGAPGPYICNRLTDLLDIVILEVFEQAVEETRQACDVDILNQVAFVAQGGYGRRELAPFSDVDLVLLHAPQVGQHLRPLARRILSDLSDLKLNIGFAVRAPHEAVQKARRDVVIFTAQTEARFLAGSVRLFSRFMHLFRRDTRRRQRQIIPRIESAQDRAGAIR